MRLVIIFVFLSLMFGCVNEQNPHIRGESHYQRNLNYFQDTRTNLCFAERTPSGVDSYSFTEVPCDKIKHIIGDVNETIPTRTK